MTEEKLKQLEDAAIRHLEKSVAKISKTIQIDLKNSKRHLAFSLRLVDTLKSLPFGIIYMLLSEMRKILQGKYLGE